MIVAEREFEIGDEYSVTLEIVPDPIWACRSTMYVTLLNETKEEELRSPVPRDQALFAYKHPISFFFDVPPGPDYSLVSAASN